MSVETLLMVDPEIAQISDKYDMVVVSGAAQTTYQQVVANSFSSSSLQFNINLPSESTVVSRNVMIQTPLAFTLTITGVPVNDVAIQWGQDTALACFPLNSLFQTIQLGLNNSSVSIDLQDQLPAILRMNNSRELFRYNSGTASHPDTAYGQYADGVGASNNVLGSYSNGSLDLDEVLRGGFPCCVTVTQQTSAGVLVNTSVISENPTNVFKVVVQTLVQEPIMCSPFSWSNQHEDVNAMGFLGLQTMSLNINLDGTAKRICSSGSAWPTTITLGTATSSNPFQFGNDYNGVNLASAYFPSAPQNPQMMFKYLSTQPSQMVPTKNVIPYYQFNRVLTPQQGNAIASGASASITTSTITLSQVPDLFIIQVRKPMTTQTIKDASAFFTINSVNITFNNQSGILSSSRSIDLWKMSQKYGSNQSWLEFSGQSLSFNPTQLLNAPVNGQYGSKIATTGSLLVMSPSEFSLPDSLAPSSMGQFQLSITLNVTNQFGVAVQPEICLSYLNTSILETNQGVSTTYTGLLNRESVLHAKSSEHSIRYDDYNMKVGGSMMSRILAGVRSHKATKRQHQAMMPMKAHKGKLMSIM